MPVYAQPEGTVSPVPVSLGVPGEHNILNALAALALADYLQLDMGTASRALKNFTGTDRRFEYKGQPGRHPP